MEHQMSVSSCLKDGKRSTRFEIKCYNGKTNPLPSTARGKRRHEKRDAAGKVRAAEAWSKGVI
jgi:hypothetical protein